MAEETYTQCIMTHGNKVTQAFIPTSAAKVNNLVELLDTGDDPPLFWTVEEVGVTLPKEKFRLQERAYKNFQGSTRGGWG